MSVPSAATVRLAAGAGLVARRPTALLYVPARDAALVDAFTASPPGTELQAVASTTVAAGFTVGPFVCLAWGSGGPGDGVRRHRRGDRPADAADAHRRRLAHMGRALAAAER